jgi:hypothetical protein
MMARVILVIGGAIALASANLTDLSPPWLPPHISISSTFGGQRKTTVAWYGWPFTYREVHLTTDSSHLSSVVQISLSSRWSIAMLLCDGIIGIVMVGSVRKADAGGELRRWVIWNTKPSQASRPCYVDGTDLMTPRTHCARISLALYADRRSPGR